MIPLPSDNHDFGFYGTMRQHGYDPAAAWSAAFPVVAAFWPAAHPKIAAKRARLFLDSSGGRHLADAIAPARNVAAAVKRALPSFYSWLR